MTSNPALGRFGDVFRPSESVEPILARRVRGALGEWLEEIWAEDELRAVGLAPRRRALFEGEPGTGKTTLAHHLAARLGLDMLAVRPDLILSRWVNGTVETLGHLFTLVAACDPPVLLFFDEFDVYAGQRLEVDQVSAQHQNDQVNVLLQRIEQYPGFLIAATNFGAAIDRAIWRRFDLHIALDLPGPGERARILARYLAPFGLPREALWELARAMETASPALMRHFCEALKRQMVLGERLGWDMRARPTIERILAAVGPHRDAGKPRLWSHGADDRAVALLPWPLPRAEALAAEAPAASEAGAGEIVIPFKKAGP
jgi:SpoVK/Ycf46/Vps4 family AAA+-type ATPase